MSVSYTHLDVYKRKALYTQIYASYEAYVDSYEEQHHSMEPERIAADLMNHNMSDSHIGTIGRALDEIQIEGTDFAIMQQAVMTPAFEQRLWKMCIRDRRGIGQGKANISVPTDEDSEAQRKEALIAKAKAEIAKSGASGESAERMVQAMYNLSADEIDVYKRQSLLFVAISIKRKSLKIFLMH